MNTGDAIHSAFISPNLTDRNMEPANIVDVVGELARSTVRVAAAITPNAIAGADAAGGPVASLTEAVMGMTAGLVKIAEAIDNLAEAVRDTKST